MQDRRSPARLSILWLLATSVTVWTGCSLSSKSTNSDPPPAAGQLAASPSSLGFGTIPHASSKVLAERISNTGQAAVTVSQISAAGTGFSFSGINPPVTLSPGQAATFNVIFTPQSDIAVTGSLSLRSNASDSPLSITLSGSGSSPGELRVSPGNVNFGNVVVGTNETYSAALSASNGPVTVNSARMNGSEFSLSGLSLPVTIAAGSSVPFGLVFAPQASGATSGTLVFTGLASNGEVTQTLNGSGTTPAQHTVTLNWNASTSNDVVGYNVYRGTTYGGPYSQINSAWETSTSASDSTVVSGGTYYYVVTAVNSRSQESAYSNQTTAVIPNP